MLFLPQAERSGAREISRDNNNIPIRRDMWHSGSPRAIATRRLQLDRQLHENSISDLRQAARRNEQDTISSSSFFFFCFFFLFKEFRERRALRRDSPLVSHTTHDGTVIDYGEGGREFRGGLSRNSIASMKNRLIRSSRSRHGDGAINSNRYRVLAALLRASASVITEASSAFVMATPAAGGTR